MSLIQSDSVLPTHPSPIIIIGAGGIVHDAHLPAYKLAGFEVAGIYDINTEKAAALARKYSIPTVFENMDQLLQRAPENIIFDLAIPGSEIIPVLQQLPQKAAVLMQKPMGNNLKEAEKIVQVTRDKEMVAGVNFQLRYAPFMNAARRLVQQGKIGELCDIEVNVNVYTPWHLWKFLYGLPRVEILYHSIHYIDLARSFLGNPSGIYAKTTKHPDMEALASVRTNIIMDYGDLIRVNILTNHCHKFGIHHQQSYIKFEGTEGAIKIRLGTLMDYPAGTPDQFEYIFLEEGRETQWQIAPIKGRWFPHAFMGSMAQVMRAAEGSIEEPDNSVNDCIDTMYCVEAAYQSSESGAIKIDYNR